MLPEIQKSIGRFHQEMSSVDEVLHVLLKGHLLLEEALTAVLEQYVFHREHLNEARLTFNQKLRLAQSLCLRKNRDDVWELISAINALRNELAHRLGSSERAKKLSRVKETYFKQAAEFKHIEQIKVSSDVSILLNACAHCAGFLAVFEADSKSFRNMVHSMDRKMNPDLPAFDL